MTLDEPNSSDKLCEVDSLLSYDGEGLEAVAGQYKDQEVALPLLIK